MNNEETKEKLLLPLLDRLAKFATRVDILSEDGSVLLGTSHSFEFSLGQSIAAGRERYGLNLVLWDWTGNGFSTLSPYKVYDEGGEILFHEPREETRLMLESVLTLTKERSAKGESFDGKRVRVTTQYHSAPEGIVIESGTVFVWQNDRSEQEVGGRLVDIPADEVELVEGEDAQS